MPSGGVPAARAFADTSRCAACHGTLAAHAGRFTTVAQCAVCHAGPAADADTGNALALGVLVHKLHRGAALPSVVAGTPYRLVDASEAVHDYSTVRFPHAVQHCEACHGVAAWKTRATAGACVACHDRVAFADPPAAGFALHGGGAQPDGSCESCHGGDASLVPIARSHLDPSFDPASLRVALTILDAPATPPGALPSLTFQVQVNGAPRDISVAPLTSLRATVAGPNSDHARFWQAIVQGSGVVGTLEAVDAASGVFRYTLPVTGAMPPDATGSYTIGLEGYLQTPGGLRLAAFSPVRALAVTDPVAVPRRRIVEAARCDACHLDLSAHGGGRKNPDHCATCHNPTNFNDERVARYEGATVLAESVDLRVMIHKIHAGVTLTQPYVLGGNPAPTAANPGGTPLDFGATRYPRPLSQCAACHLDGTWALPVQSSSPSLLAELTCSESPADDTDLFCDAPFFTPSRTIALRPAAAACTSCHDAPDAAVHAELNTTVSGAEGCATCHGPGSTWDVAAVHAP